MRYHSTPTIARVLEQKSNIEILWSDKKVTRFPYVYLLDNQPSAAVSRAQRAFHCLESELRPKETVLSRDSNTLAVRWQNGNQSVFPIEWLAERRYGTNKCSKWLTEERIHDEWDSKCIEEKPRFEFGLLQTNEELLLEMLQQLQSRGYALVVNAGKDRDTATKFAHLLDTVPRPSHYR